MYNVLVYIALFIGIIPLIFLLYKKKAFDIKQPIAPFIWTTALATIYEFVGTLLLKINATYWFQLYSLLELAALYYFFYKLFTSRYINILRVFAALLVIAYFISFCFWSTGTNFASRPLNAVSITSFTLIFSFLWFRDLFREMDIANPWQESTFYFVSGFSIYYSSTFLLFLLSNFIFNSSMYFNDYWLINVMATLILRTCLIVGVWKMK